MHIPLYIPYNEFDKNFGGSYSFLINFRKYLNSKQISTIDSLDKSEGIFFPMYYDVDKLKKYKKKGGKIIQRLDGIYYPTKHGEKYNYINKVRKESYELADFVIFQSEYSKKQCFTMFGEKPDNQHTIVINGADKEIFFPAENKPNNSKIKFITTGGFRNIDMLAPVIDALDEIGNIQFELHIVGDVTNEKLLPYLDRNYITTHGYKNLNDIAVLLRDSDVFIYSHLNPPCPNSVIEAISCGLPIVGFNSGAMSELCWFSKDLLADVSGHIYQLFTDFDYKKLKEKIIYVTKNLDHYKNIAYKHANLYSFTLCGEEYLKSINSALKRGTHHKEETNLKNIIKSKFFSSKIYKRNIKALYSQYNDCLDTNAKLAEIENNIEKALSHNSAFESLLFLFQMNEMVQKKLEVQVNRYYEDNLKCEDFQLFNYISSLSETEDSLLFLNWDNKQFLMEISKTGRKCFLGTSYNSHNEFAIKKLDEEYSVFRDTTNEHSAFDMVIFTLHPHNHNLSDFIEKIKIKFAPKTILLKSNLTYKNKYHSVKHELGLHKINQEIIDNEAPKLEQLFTLISKNELTIEDIKFNGEEICLIVN